MNIILVGISGGIGKAMYEQLCKIKNAHIITTARTSNCNQKNSNNQYFLDITKTQSIDTFCRKIEEKCASIDWVINCTGVLHTTKYKPEKSLRQLNKQQLTENFITNAAGHLLLLKGLENLIASSKKAMVASISARIGSISDNQLGGWYAYRMSKAALNMGYKTLSVEWKRKYPHISLLLFHPGTTDTDLSKPFHKGLKIGQLQTAEYTAKKFMEIINKKLNGDDSELFQDYNGEQIPW